MQRFRHALGLAFVVTAATGSLGCGLVLGLGDFEDAEPSASGGSGGAGGGATNSSSSTGGSGGSVLCEPGAVESCYSADPATEGIGNCQPGERTCNAAGDGFGPCEGEVGPSPETCATTVDDDCDGAVNEDGDGCDCEPGKEAPCYSGPSGTDTNPPCHQGKQICNDNGVGYGACTDEVIPAAETCDMGLVDEDCDAKINEEGAGCVCAPDATVDCYDGPAGTEDVGICKSGTQQCNMYGTDFTGACTGQTLPGTEVCSAAPDEDCSGLACSQPLFAALYGEGEGLDVATDSAGNLVVMGVVNGTANFGGGPLISNGDDLFVAKFDPSMTHLWSKTFGGTNRQKGEGVAIDANGNIVVAGYYREQLIVGGTTYPNAGNLDAFVMKLDPSGTVLWTKTYGDSSGQQATDVAVDGAGNVLVIGGFTGTVNFGTGALTAAGLLDVFVLKLSAAGVTQWAKRYGDAGGQNGTSVASDSANNVLITGSFDGSMDFGGGAITATDQNGFLVKLDSNGSHVWTKNIGFTGWQLMTDLVVDGMGRPSIAGVFDTAFALPGGSTLTPGGNFDIFVGQFSSAGNHVWSKSFPGTGNETSAILGIDGSGNLLLTNVSFSASLDFGGGPLASAGVDVFAAKFDGAGSHVWSKVFGDGSIQQAQGITGDGSGNVYLTGANIGTVDFGTGALTTALGNIYVAKFAP